MYVHIEVRLAVWLQASDVSCAMTLPLPGSGVMPCFLHSALSSGIFILLSSAAEGIFRVLSASAGEEDGNEVAVAAEESVVAMFFLFFFAGGSLCGAAFCFK